MRRPEEALALLGFGDVGSEGWRGWDTRPPPPGRLRPGWMYQINSSTIPALRAAWRACAAVRAAAPKAPLQDMVPAWTRTTAWHWRQAAGSLSVDTDFYTEREMAEARKELHVVNVLLRSAEATACRKTGSCVQIASKSESFMDSVVRLAGRRHVGMAAGDSDVTAVYGRGWQGRCGYLDLTTARTAKTTTATDLLDTQPADRAVEELQNATLRLVGERGVVGGQQGLRGLFLYPRHGFREWHSNRFDAPGWRMYLVATEEDGRSWFAARDPRTGTVHHLPDYNGKVNLFRISGAPEDMIWHSIYSMTDRWSCGIHLSDSAAREIIKLSGQAAPV